MSVVTKQLREGEYYDEDGNRHSYPFRILAVAKRDSGGKLHCPVLDFLQEYSKKHSDDLARLSALLESTARYGPRWIDSQFKRVKGTDGLLEFKAFQLRLYCFWDGGDLIICTNGAVKKKDRTDSAVLGIAANWKSTYLTAKQKNLLSHEPEH